MCDALNSNHSYQCQNLPLPVYNTYVNWPGKDPATNPATPDFSFEKFFSLNYTLSAYKTPAEHAAADYTPVGTFYNNLDARYMVGSYSFAFGQVLVVGARCRRRPIPMPAEANGRRAVARVGHVRRGVAGGHRHLQVPV